MSPRQQSQMLETRNAAQDGSGEAAAEAVPLLLWVVVAFAAITGLLMGFDLSIVAVILNSLDAEFNLCPDNALDCWPRKLFVSIIAPGALLGSLGGGWIADAWGRRAALLMSDVSFIVGSVLFFVPNSLVVVFTARAIIGCGIGIGFVVFSTYMAEIAPPSRRGRLILCQEVAQCAGVFGTYIIATWLRNTNWRLFAASGGVIAFVQLLGISFLPESPRWLIMQDRAADAYEVMARLGVDKTELDNGESELRRSGTGVARRHVGSLFWTHKVELLTACFVGIAQNVLCLNAVLYFSVDLFYLAEVCKPLEWGISIGVVKLVGTLIVFPLVDTLGRRQLLLAGTGALFGVNLLMAYAYALSPLRDLETARTFCSSPAGADLGPLGLAGAHSVLMIIALCLIVLCWEISWAGLMYVVASEIIPSSIRGIGMGLVVFCFWVSSFSSQILFESMFRWLTVIGTFVGLSVASLVILTITYLSVPDMTGKSLEMIKRLMSKTDVPHDPLEFYLADSEQGPGAQQRTPSTSSMFGPGSPPGSVKRRQGPTDSSTQSHSHRSDEIATLLPS